MTQHYLPDSDMNHENLYWIILTMKPGTTARLRSDTMWATMIADCVDEVSDRIVKALSFDAEFVAFRDTIVRIDDIESYQIRKYRGRDFT